MELQNEGGVTAISIANAKRLLDVLGKPERLELTYTDEDWYRVTAVWPLGRNHTFTGFSWGYNGEGPRGLEIFCRMCGIKVDLPEISRWPMKEPRTLLVPGDHPAS